MGLWATQSRGKALWMKAKAVTITKRLENARVLRPPSAHVERSNHGSYLQKLRLGVKMIAGDSVVANFLNDARANVKAEEAQKALAAGLVQAERYDGDKELAEWQQGDRSMYTSENLKRRMALRRHALVTASLQLFWEAALRSVQSGGDTTAGALHRVGYETMMNRIYRALMQEWDPIDAATCIEEDWERDSRGRDHLTREMFFDSIFELVDVWTKGIAASDYVEFCETLFHHVVEIVDGKYLTSLEGFSTCNATLTVLLCVLRVPLCCR